MQTVPVGTPWVKTGSVRQPSLIHLATAGLGSLVFCCGAAANVQPASTKNIVPDNMRKVFKLRLYISSFLIKVVQLASQIIP